jgi:hypothetical protein
MSFNERGVEQMGRAENSTPGVCFQLFTPQTEESLAERG